MKNTMAPISTHKGCSDRKDPDVSREILLLLLDDISFFNYALFPKMVGSASRGRYPVEDCVPQVSLRSTW
ncbi:MAG: hypothetical protein J6X55_01265, partial [Victivallales bacterium]|nr:hypothetical protein [Victivallales bacterium]